MEEIKEVKKEMEQIQTPLQAFSRCLLATLSMISQEITPTPETEQRNSEVVKAA